jgi:hypothetical protein
MGTRSDIIVEGRDGKFRRIYCHWDGYLENNGQILQDHYTSQDKCDALVMLGSLSTLKAEIGEKHIFEVFRLSAKQRKAHKAKYGNMCAAYHRDRGEELRIDVGDTLQAVWPEEDTWTEFTYVWRRDLDGGRWFVASADEGSQALIPLSEALAGKQSVRANIKVFGAVVGKHS